MNGPFPTLAGLANAAEFRNHEGPLADGEKLPDFGVSVRIGGRCHRTRFASGRPRRARAAVVRPCVLVRSSEDAR